jgi:signal transduction histidine kinase
VRRITRRLEALQAGVDDLGEGDLGARVEVKGKDEVARLAGSFNRAAARIEQLVGSQKNLLASVSHELRTPLARLRVAIELLSGEERPELRQRIERDIGELDALIGELLLASRLDASVELETRDEVDLLALLAEEAVHTGAEVSGEAVALRGDPRMLRRLVRNLLENARRYGAGSPVEARVTRDPDGGARLQVEDRGPGVPEAERDRIFEPFYRSASSAAGEPGTGLGLALVRQIARRHGGEARCLARPEGGSCFEVVIPAA